MSSSLLSFTVVVLSSFLIISCGSGKAVQANTTLVSGRVTLGEAAPSEPASEGATGTEAQAQARRGGGGNENRPPVTPKPKPAPPAPTPAPPSAPVAVTPAEPTAAPTQAPQAAPARSAIVTCTKTGTDIAGNNQIYFRGADCSDGNLPDSSYLAILSNLRADGGTSGEYALGQTLTGDPAFVKFFANVAGSYTIQVSYLRSSLANVVSCLRRGTVTQNNMRIDYQPGDCSGGRLPDNRHLGTLSAFLVGGGSDGGWRVSQPFKGQSATVNFWANTVGAQFAVRVMYVVALPGPLVVCSRTGTTIAGLNSPPYLAAGCDAGRLPSTSSIAFQSAVQVQNGHSGNLRFHQPYLDGAAQTNFQATTGGTSYSIQTVYGEF